eukprot:CAMPEP_0117758148 /NCGR_PEP_ID=MMETSP0947-20121206/15196_1 /TAXON_ID=44440 /ORGANISM="Chattonella subsalsa, Strain CCMP2191" /LENGTH=407 /DNA_ID=CAMNT_0005578261 /DNA_START=646 /DNA_END=1869 /DNA_ORIENTATION=+
MHKKKIKNLSRVKKEIEIIASLSHPNIVTLHDVYEDQKFLHIITPLYSGGELFEKIVQRPRFSEKEAVSIIQQLLDAVAYCHERGVVHRDLKPENVIYESKEPNSAIKVIDFGLASFNETGSNNMMQSFVGTTYFLDPEIIQQKFTSKCDIWAVGIIMYILLCGYPPFMGESTPQTLNQILHDEVHFGREWSHVSSDAKHLIQQLLQKHSCNRPTADTALSHPWFTNTTGEQLSLFYASSNFMQKRFHRHIMRSKLQKIAINRIAHQLTENEISHLQSFFEQLDQSGNGLLYMKDLGWILQQVTGDIDDDIERTIGAFAAMDINSDTTIDLSEFIAAALDRNICIREENLLAAFTYFDTNNSEFISPHELMNFFGTSEHVQEEIEAYDLDDNGKLDFPEFRKMVMQS